VAVDLLYKMSTVVPYGVSDANFFFADNLSGAMRVLSVLIRDRGLSGAAKAVAKIALGRCIYFGLRQGSMPQSTGTLALGYCRFYPVEKDAIVIGEIVTAPERRGRGLATLSIMLAVNSAIQRGTKIFYIDTQRNNHAMQRSIAKLGFGAPIAGDAVRDHR
jgi:RimJ/RimL family protein N-acetyltransferase